jgi:hypothetical protein
LQVVIVTPLAVWFWAVWRPFECRFQQLREMSANAAFLLWVIGWLALGVLAGLLGPRVVVHWFLAEQVAFVRSSCRSSTTRRAMDRVRKQSG